MIDEVTALVHEFLMAVTYAVFILAWLSVMFTNDLFYDEYYGTLGFFILLEGLLWISILLAREYDYQRLSIDDVLTLMWADHFIMFSTNLIIIIARRNDVSLYNPRPWDWNNLFSAKSSTYQFYDDHLGRISWMAIVFAISLISSFRSLCHMVQFSIKLWNGDEPTLQRIFPPILVPIF